MVWAGVSYSGERRYCKWCREITLIACRARAPLDPSIREIPPDLVLKTPWSIRLPVIDRWRSIVLRAAGITRLAEKCPED